jgi:hypothetical protein
VGRELRALPSLHRRHAHLCDAMMQSMMSARELVFETGRHADRPHGGVASFSERTVGAATAAIKIPTTCPSIALSRRLRRHDGRRPVR